MLIHFLCYLFMRYDINIKCLGRLLLLCLCNRRIILKKTHIKNLLNDCLNIMLNRTFILCLLYVSVSCRAAIRTALLNSGLLSTVKPTWNINLEHCFTTSTTGKYTPSVASFTDLLQCELKLWFFATRLWVLFYFH